MIAPTTHQPTIDQFCSDVLDGTFVAGRLERYAVERYLDDLENGHKRGLTFDVDAANRAIDFFPVLKHTTGEFAGEPFELRLFQKFIVWNLYGWKRADGLRRFRQSFISFARGNGKSPFAAAMANKAFLDREDPRAQVYTFATKEDQAKIVWAEARKQIEASGSPSLLRLVERYKKSMAILNEPYNGSIFEPKGSDSKSADGWILSFGVVDELHAFAHYHRGLVDKIVTSMGKRKEPMLVYITTAGDENSEVWQEQYDYASQVVTPGNGIEDDAFFTYICEEDKERDCDKCNGQDDTCQTCKGKGTIELDPLDEALWPQANPMLREPNSPVKIDFLRSLANKARHAPSALNQFKRYHANQQVASFFKWMTPELWAKGNGKLDEDKLAGRSCYGGFDWGWRDDLASLGLIFPGDEGKLELKCFAWIPEGTERDLTAEPWASFIAKGWLTVTPGDTTDVDAIYATLETVIESYQLDGLAYDPANAREFSTRCYNEYQIPLVEMYQNCRNFNEPTRGFAKALRQGKIRHGNNGLLAWCSKNVAVKEDSNGYQMPYKLKSRDKIDPIVALIMAFRQCLTGETEPTRDYYESNELEVA